MFEIVRRDGLARMGRFTVGGRVVETPALLPVVNPKICTVPPADLAGRFGFQALITNSYIIRGSPELRARALDSGLHEMLGFPGVIMTDSGTFQSHMYGEVGVTNGEIVEFQRSIGSDIGTVLDVFTEPDWSHERAERALDETLERTREACALKGDMMINGVVQGSVYADLRERSAREMASMDVDVHPIGGVVPLMEGYRFADLVDVVMASKTGLNPSRPVHLFGAGHPMVLALAALMGCDLFDSASYAKFARDGRMMFPEGTFRLEDMQALDCGCPACRGVTLKELRSMGVEERTRLIAEHNLQQISHELSAVRRAICEGRLWELAETRCRAHPALLDGLRRLGEWGDLLERHDPVSRPGAVFYTGPESRNRPAYARYAARLMERYVPETPRAAVFADTPGKPYGRAYAAEFERARRAGYTPVVVSAWGPVPAELDEMYPLAQSLFPENQDMETVAESEGLAQEFLLEKFEEVVEYEDVPDAGPGGYDADMARAKAVARHQFGIAEADALFRGEVELVKSRRTGRIRNVVSDGEHVLSMRAGDGLYTLRMEGARRIVGSVPAPRMRVAVCDDAVPFVSEGRNAFCQFVLSCDPGIRPMEEVVVTDSGDRPIATGRAFLTAGEMLSMGRGMAVKVRSGSDEERRGDLVRQLLQLGLLPLRQSRFDDHALPDLGHVLHRGDAGVDELVRPRRPGAVAYDGVPPVLDGHDLHVFQRGGHLRVQVVVVRGRGEHEVREPERLGHRVRRVLGRQVDHGDRHPAAFQHAGEQAGRPGRVPVHGVVEDRDAPLLGLVAAPEHVLPDEPVDVSPPDGAVQRAHDADVQSGDLLQGLAHARPVPADDVRVVPARLVQVVALEVQLVREDRPAEGAERPERVRREQHPGRLVEREHHLGPVDHRRRQEHEPVRPHLQDVPVADDHPVGRLGVVEVHEHVERQGARHDGRAGPSPHRVPESRAVVGLHVADHYVVQRIAHLLAQRVPEVVRHRLVDGV